MPGVLVFDVNETLLDLRALDPHFERIFGDASVRAQWFALVLRTAMSLTITGDYRDFVAVGGGSLRMVAEERGVILTADDHAAIAGMMTSLPPHPDVARNLARLADQGFRIAALTNSPPEAAGRQLASAGIDHHFDRIMSVADVGKFKPAPEVYRRAETELAATPAELTLVAAHDWDVAGAMAVGWRGAYLMRSGMVRNPLFPDPDVTGRDLDELAGRLIAFE